jgi:hypothetical protein
VTDVVVAALEGSDLLVELVQLVHQARDGRRIGIKGRELLEELLARPSDA